MDIKILSWNIWVDGDTRQVVEFIRDADPDIIGLQEVKDDDPTHEVIEPLRAMGYHQVFAPVPKTIGSVAYNDGPAIFSKYPIVASKVHTLSTIDARVAVQTDIAINDKSLHVFSTHLLHTHQRPSETQELQAKDLVNKLPTERTIVMGDCNATPESAAIKLLRTVLRDTDTASQPTWSVHREGCAVCDPQKIDTRLDYIFVSRDLAFRSFAVGRSDASDHLPISVIVEV